MELLLGRALHAVAAPLRTPDVCHGSTTDAVDAAADALRALASFATAAGFPAGEAELATVERMLALLQEPGRLHTYQARVAVGKMCVSVCTASRSCLC